MFSRKKAVDWCMHVFLLRASRADKVPSEIPDWRCESCENHPQRPDRRPDTNPVQPSLLRVVVHGPDSDVRFSNQIYPKSLLTGYAEACLCGHLTTPSPRRWNYATRS